MPPRFVIFASRLSPQRVEIDVFAGGGFAKTCFRDGGLRVATGTLDRTNSKAKNKLDIAESCHFVSPKALVSRISVTCRRLRRSVKI